jgi:hypothetical protein
MLGTDGEPYDQVHEHACYSGHGDGLHLRDGTRETWIPAHTIQVVTITDRRDVVRPDVRRVERRDSGRRV